MQRNLEISFLPWAGLQESVELGPVAFWSYHNEATYRIEDVEVRGYLDRYFKSYVDHQGRSVKTITVCSVGDVDCRQFSDEEYRHVRDAVNALVFAAIAPSVVGTVCSGNYSVGPPSADAFELITQRFILGDDHIAVRAGSLLSGGLRIGKVSFSKPWAMGGGLWRIVPELLMGLRARYSKAIAPEILERIRLSLDWFRLAHIDGAGVSVLTKVIMMVCAFEILLAFPEDRKKWYFARYMDNNIASDKFLRDERYTRSGKARPLTLAGCWAFDFYELRSRIVHGEAVTAAEMVYKGEITSLIAADVVFWECVKRLLFELECIGDDVRACSKRFDEIYPESPAGGILDHIGRSMLGFNETHEALGWVAVTDG